MRDPTWSETVEFPVRDRVCGEQVSNYRLGREDTTWIVSSDVLYGESLHTQLLAIFDANLAPGGRILLADPFRSMSIRFLEAMESDGWGVSMARYDLGEDMARRSVGVFELSPPR